MQVLIHIFKVRVQVSQLRLLRFRQSHVPDTLGLPPVLQCDANKVGNAGHSTQAGEGDADRVTRTVEVDGVGTQKGIRRNDTAEVAKAHLPCCADRTPVVATKIHIEPAHNDWHGGIRPHDDEEKRGILEVQSVVDVEQDGEARYRQGQGCNCEGSAVSDPIRNRGNQQREPKGHSPWGHGVKLSLNRAVLIRCDDCGCEECVSVRLLKGSVQHLEGSDNLELTGTISPKYIRPPSHTL